MRPMLAGKYPGDTKLRFPLICQPKLDGIRAVVVGGKLLSRTLKPIPNAEIRRAMERPEFEGFDGELIVGPPTADDCYRRTCSFVMAEDKTDEPWKFYAFDLWNLPTVSYLERAVFLSNAIMAIKHEQRISPLEHVFARSLDELNEAEAAWVAEGYEGAILRGPDSFYKYGRGNATNMDLLKLKRFSDAEAEIIGTTEEMHNTNEAKTNALGRTERSTAQAGKVGKGTLGKLICRTPEGVEFGIGTGFTAQERAELWQDREQLIGQIAKYKFFDVGVKTAPRHPVMLGLRNPIDIGDPA